MTEQVRNVVASMLDTFLKEYSFLFEEGDDIGEALYQQISTHADDTLVEIASSMAYRERVLEAILDKTDSGAESVKTLLISLSKKLGAMRAIQIIAESEE